MNAVEIEEAVSALADAPFDPKEFAYSFLRAFGNKDTTIAKLRSGASNASDILGGVLQRSNIHIATCSPGETSRALTALRVSPKTATAKARFILTTDGTTFEAEDLTTGETIACSYTQFPDHFGFFLPLAGISTVKQIRESAFDIRATGRLNKLYLTLRKDNPAWDTPERQQDMNHFMARLIFCFFAEDTDIFLGNGLFTSTVEQMSAPDASNTHEVIGAIFRTMNIRPADRPEAKLPRWADAFPYVNGGLFAGDTEVPHFTKIARAYLVHIGKLEWRQINPDIFGSMIQAVADDEERGALGMHYTSVPNILKVLNPLFLDDLRSKLEDAGENGRMLLNLRKRLARIRVFDPACGSGNFLVIAYKEMRAIEVEINKRRGEIDRKTDIPITNFRGIEVRSFPAEIARLALIIAEYQCDVLYRGQKEALAEFLPLDTDNWIACGNALRLDWVKVCPPTGLGVKVQADDLFSTPLDQAQIDFENEGGETFICGNPPYFGSRRQEDEQKLDLKEICSSFIPKWKSLDYVSAWLLKASDYLRVETGKFAFVCTSSISEGLAVSVLWPRILEDSRYIFFAHRPFKWSNLAKSNAGVTVVIVGVTNIKDRAAPQLFEGTNVRSVPFINAYLVPAAPVYVGQSSRSVSNLPAMIMGSMPRDGGHLILSQSEVQKLASEAGAAVTKWIRKYVGSDELISGKLRYCLWISDSEAEEAISIPALRERFRAVSEMREKSPLQSTKDFAGRPHRFVYLAGASRTMTVAVGGVSSETRHHLPVDVFDPSTVISNLAFAIYDAPLWTFSVIASRLHLIWIAAVCGKLETRYRYSNTLGWNTFPIPSLTDQNKADLIDCANAILLAREAHFPATIADLYDPENMPDDLHAAHKRNDEVLERIYIGRRFRNDTERLEKLFELYTKMTAGQPKEKATRKKKGAA